VDSFKDVEGGDSLDYGRDKTSSEGYENQAEDGDRPVDDVDEEGLDAGMIWDLDLIKMSDQLNRWRARQGWADEHSVARNDREPVPNGLSEVDDNAVNEDAKESPRPIQGETKERREEVLDLIRARLVRVFRDVYYK
jgi:hypothetical protein